MRRSRTVFNTMSPARYAGQWGRTGSRFTGRTGIYFSLNNRQAWKNTRLCTHEDHPVFGQLGFLTIDESPVDIRGNAIYKAWFCAGRTLFDNRLLPAGYRSLRASLDRANFGVWHSAEQFCPVTCHGGIITVVLVAAGSRYDAEMAAMIAKYVNNLKSHELCNGNSLVPE